LRDRRRDHLWRLLVLLRRAAHDLKDETTRLRKKVDSVLNGLQDAGLVRLRKDDAGEIEGVLVTVAKSLDLRWKVEDAGGRK
jgi:hypothetical protein